MGLRRVWATVLVGLIALLLAAPSAWAVQPLDPSFGQDGIAMPGLIHRAFTGLAEAPAAGAFGTGPGYGSGGAISRYLSSGALDPSFGEGGASPKVTFGNGQEIRTLATEPDGDLIGAGFVNESWMLVVRYRPDGSLDPSFGDGGVVKTPLFGFVGGARDVVVLPGGRILAAGYSYNRFHQWHAVALAYRPDGTLDRHFGGGDGIVNYETLGREVIRFDAAAVLPDRHILLLGDVGGRLFLVQLNQAGEPDRSFGRKGLIYYDLDGSPFCSCSEAAGLAVDRRGRPVLAATTGDRDTVVMRLLPNGRRDRSFGEEGVVRRTLGTRLGAEDVVVQRNGKIAVPGFYNAPGGEARVAVLRLLPDGRPDPTFGRRGLYTHDFGHEGVADTALALRDGDLLVGGRANPTAPATREVFETAEPFLIRFRP